MAEPVTGPRPVAGAVHGWWFWAWIALRGLSAVGVLGTAVGALDGAEVIALGAPFALIAGLMLIAELRPVVTAGAYDPHGVTISTAFVFAILFYWGPWPALLVHGAGVMLGEIAKRKPVGRSSSTPVSTSAAWPRPQSSCGWPDCTPPRCGRPVTSTRTSWP